MRIDIRISQADFAHALSQFLPVTIWLDTAHTRWVHIGAAMHVGVEKDVGVRLAAPLKLNWAIAGIDTALQVDRAQLSMRPEIAPKGKGFELVFHLALEDASVKGVPALFDGTIVAAVNAALERTHLAWCYTDTINNTFPMGALFDSVSGVTLEAGPGKQEIVGDAIVLSMQLQVGFSRQAPPSDSLR